jgi:4-alpha-glucanotransferase
MGDIPIGISVASADVFADRDIFDLDWYGGAPPETLFKDDEFVQKWGQNWGIPLYRWDVLKARDYDWWRQRVRKTAEICGMFRVDHALGFYRIYSFPWNPVRNEEFLPLSHEEAAERCEGRLPGFRPRDDDNEENKAANRREGEEYLRVLMEAAGEAEIIAEDLGTVPDYVRPSLAELGIAGMKVPQWEFHDGSIVRGGHYPEVSFATYASHDHAAIKVQWNEKRATILTSEAGSHEWHEARNFISNLLDYCSIAVTQFDEFPLYDRNFLDALFWTICLSNSGRIAITVTDLLYSGDRINVPGIMSDKNWTYRIPATVSELRESSEWEWMRDMSKNILNETARAIKVATV